MWEEVCLIGLNIIMKYEYIYIYIYIHTRHIFLHSLVVIHEQLNA